MKKALLTIAIVFGISLCSFAQFGGGLFQYGAVNDEDYGMASRLNNEGLLSMPTTHGYDHDVEAPLGSGIAMLVGLGGAYLLTKRRKK